MQDFVRLANLGASSLREHQTNLLEHLIRSLSEEFPGTSGTGASHVEDSSRRFVADLSVERTLAEKWARWDNPKATKAHTTGCF